MHQVFIQMEVAIKFQSWMKKYQDVFEMENIDVLPKYWYNKCEINLQVGTQLLFEPIYNLLQKIVLLKEYINKNISNNFIQSSKSFVSFLILIIYKKR